MHELSPEPVYTIPAIDNAEGVTPELSVGHAPFVAEGFATYLHELFLRHIDLPYYLGLSRSTGPVHTMAHDCAPAYEVGRRGPATVHLQVRGERALEAEPRGLGAHA